MPETLRDEPEPQQEPRPEPLVASGRAASDLDLMFDYDRFATIAKHGRILAWRGSVDGTVTHIWGFEDFFGGTSFDWRDNAWLDHVHPADLEALQAARARSMATGEICDIEFRLRMRDGSLRWLNIRRIPRHDADKRIVEWVGTVADIHDHKMATEAMRDREKLIALAVAATGMGIWSHVVGEELSDWSPQVRMMTGIGQDVPMTTEMFYAMVHPEDRPFVRATFEGVLARRDPKPYDIVYRLYRGDTGQLRWLQEWGTVMFDPRGEPLRLVGLALDITEKKAAEEALCRAATRDALTGLLNRGALHGELDRVLAAVARNGGEVALLLVDLDDFKDVNDTMGHDVGDQILTTAAERLAALVGEVGRVGRLGGDEFAVVLDGDTAPDAAADAAERILARLAEPLHLRGKMLTIAATIGVACRPATATNRESLLKDADLALYAGKTDGGRQCRLYQEGLRSALDDWTRLSAELRVAVAAGQLVPFYQPKVDLRQRRIVGFEALARWIHPERGVLTPQVFAAAFEDCRLGQAIDEAVLRQVAADIAAWQVRGLAFGRIAVNVCAATLARPDVVDQVLGWLDEQGVPPSKLEIEITETVFLDARAEKIPSILRQFRAAAIRISLDDFGTGYASLTHLKRFPVDDLKIDRSFVRDIEDDAEDAAIVAAVINLGRCLSLGVIAEGIETEGQAAMLADLGCTIGQGYLFGKPMPASRVPRALERPATDHDRHLVDHVSVAAVPLRSAG